MKPDWSLDKLGKIRFLYCALVLLLYIFAYYYETHNNIKNDWFGGDYLAFWSAGKIADTQGFHKIYDSTLNAKTQLEIINKPGYDDASFNYIPFPYFSIVVVPFKYLSRMNFLTSHWVWIVINWFLLISYTLFFITRLFPKYHHWQLLLLLIPPIMLSFPTFNNFSWAQIDVLFLICTGEIIRASVSKKYFATGFWTGFLLLKPQLIILILPLLLMERNFRLIKGFLVSSVFLFLFSFLLSGLQGMTEMVKMWLGYYPGMYPEGMMNWRMVGLRLNILLQNNLGWLVTLIGVVITLYYFSIMVKKRPQFGSPEWVIVSMGVFAATCVVTWHSHVHMVIILIPFLIYGFLKRRLPIALFDLWILFPAIFLLLSCLVFWFRTGDIINILTNGHGFVAPIFLLINMVICYWVAKLPISTDE